MATKEFSILNTSLNYDDSGLVFPRRVDQDFGGTALYDTMVIYFANGSARNGFYGAFSVPKDYVGTPKIIPVWSSTAAAAASVVWDFEYVAVGGDASESLDPAATAESLTVTDEEAGTARFRQTAPIALTAGNLAADDTVLFGFFRDATDAADTIAQPFLFDLLFQYTNS